MVKKVNIFLCLELQLTRIQYNFPLGQTDYKSKVDMTKTEPN